MRISLIAVVLLFLAGCNCGAPTGGTGGGAGGTGGGTGGSGGGAAGGGSGGGAGPCSVPDGGCNAVIPQGAVVPLSYSAALRPAATGGTIANGLYELTEMTLFENDGGNPIILQSESRDTLVFDGGMVSRATHQFPLDGGSCTTRRSEVLMLERDAGNWLYLRASCPTNCADCGDKGTYSADGGSLVFFTHDLKLSQTYSRR